MTVLIIVCVCNIYFISTIVGKIQNTPGTCDCIEVHEFLQKYFETIENTRKPLAKEI